MVPLKPLTNSTSVVALVSTIDSMMYEEIATYAFQVTP